MRFLLLLWPGLFLTYLIRFSIGIPTNVLEFSTAILVVLWLLGLLFLKSPLPSWSKWHCVALLLFLLAPTITTLSTVWHLPQGDQVPLGIWKGWFMAPALYYLMLISFFRKKSELEKLMDVGLGLIGLSAGVLLIQFFTGFFSEVTATVDHRLVWPYLDPWTGKGSSGNYPALFFSPFLALSFMNLTQSQEKLDRWFYGMLVFVMAITIYFTKSYGAWIAIIGALSLCSFFQFSGVRRWILVPMVTIVVLGLLYLDQKNTEKFRYGLDTKDDAVISSSEERLNIWKVSWDLIQKNPFLGVGPGQFQKAFEYQGPFTLGRDVSRTEINHALHPHNTLLMVWLSNGVLGMFAYFFLISIWWTFTPRKYKLLFAAPLLYLLAHGLIDTTYFKNDLAYSFFFLGALMTVSFQSHRARGVVEKGLEIGRSIGFPTANIRLEHELEYPYGVYSVDIWIGKLKKRGLLYLGPRKTKGLPENMVCEITILDFEGELYDQKISFTIRDFIRGPREFSSPEELGKQIEKDVLIAKYRKLV